MSVANVPTVDARYWSAITLIARTMNACVRGKSPKANVRTIALSLFDALDAHPWAGSALTDSPGQSSVLRVLERIGRELADLHVPKREQWVAEYALLHYIIGVGGQNAANGELARARGLDRDDFLKKTSSAWSELDPEEYSFVRSIAGQFQAHDDRTDFLAGIDFILRGIGTARHL
jgi:hypothetical protein